MNEPQVWTLIGVFAASMFGMLRMTHKSFADLLRAEIGGLRGEIGGLRGEMSAEIGGLRGEMSAEIGGLRGEMSAEIGGLRGEMDAKFDGLRGEMNANFNAQNVKLDHLGRDVQALVRRVFPEYPEAS